MRDKLDKMKEEKTVIECKEVQVAETEQALERKMDKLKNKENDIDVKLKSLEEWEESIEEEKKKLKDEKQQLCEDIQDLVVCKAGLENLEASVKTEKLQIISEKESLKIRTEEQEHHFILQSQLEQEIDKYRKLTESLVKETEDLSQERKKFEGGWESLDEKRIVLEKERKQLNDERERFEKCRQREEERLRNEALEMKVCIQRETEDLYLKKEAFEGVVKHEKLEACEVIKGEHADIARELELQKHKLEMDMQKKLEDMEMALQKRVAEFDRRRDGELSHIKSSSDLNESKHQGLKAEQDRLEREREQLSTYREKLDADQVEVQKDINASCVLTRNLKHQQNEFFKERKCFLALAEKCKICKSCGFTSELEHLGFQQLTSLEDAGNVVDAYLEENLENKNTTLPCYGSGSEPVNSGGRLSWLRKCSRLFSFSPGKRYDHRASAEAERSVLFCEQLDKSDLKGESNFEFPPLHGIYNDSFDARRATSGSGASDDLLLEIIHKVAAEPELFRVGTDDSTKIIKTQSSNVIRGRKYEPIVSLSNENDSQTELIKQRRSQSSGRGQSKAIKRTHSVEAVVADAKAFLGNNSELMDGMSNEDAIYSWNVHKENHGDYVNTSQIATNASRKRRVTHSAVAIGKLDAEDSEAYSDSVSMGGHHKRHQTSAPGIQASVEKRYNLRRSTIAGATQMMSDRNIGNKASNPQSHNENEMSKGEEGVFTIAASHENMETKIKLHKTDTDLEVQEISSQNLVKTETEVACVEFPDDIHSEFREPSCEDRGVIGEEAVTNTTTTSGEECGIEDDEDSSEDDGSGNASIGSKIWSFLTM